MKTAAKKARGKSLKKSSFSKPHFLVFVAAFVLVGGAVIWRSFAAGSGPVMYLSPSSQTITTGASFSVQIRVNNQNNPPGGQNSADAYVTFPANLLTANSISGVGSSFDFDEYDNIDNNSGILEVDRSNSTDLPQSDLLLATVSFTAKAAGSAGLDFASYSRLDQYRPPGLQNASVTVSNPAPPSNPTPPGNPAAPAGSGGGSSGSSGSSTSSGSGTKSTTTPTTPKTTTKPPPASTGTGTATTPAPATSLQGTSDSGSQTTPVTKLPTTDSTAPGPVAAKVSQSTPDNKALRITGIAVVGMGLLLAVVWLLAAASRKNKNAPAPASHTKPPPLPKHPAAGPKKLPPAVPEMMTFSSVAAHRDPYAWMPKPKNLKAKHHLAAGAAEDNYVEPEDMFAEGSKRLSQEGLADKPPGQPKA